MNDDQIRDMVSALVQEVDYDIWKELYLNDIGEIDRLIEIVKGHLEQSA